MYKARLSIQETSWSGFHDRLRQSSVQDKETYTVEVFNGGEIKLDQNNKYTLLVKEVDQDFVRLYSRNLSTLNREGKSYIHPEPFEKTIRINSSEKFLTPTFDAGTHWEIKLLSVEKINPEENDIQVPLTTPNQSQTPAKPPVKIKYPLVHFTKTQEIIAQLETSLNTKLIIYFVPPTDMISRDHPDYFLEHLRKIGHQQKITLVLCSFGGDPMASIRIANLIRSYCDKFEVVIPAEGTSAATQLALSADKILFSSIGYLGPIDAQIMGIRDPKMLEFGQNTVSFDSFRRAHEMLKGDGGSSSAYEKLFAYIPPLVVAEVDKLSSRSKRTAINMMKMHPESFNNDDSVIEEIADKLVFGYPVHNYPILFEEARSLGLPAESVSEEISLKLWDLIKLLKSDTKAVKTFINPEITHLEGVSVLIESINRRLIKREVAADRYLESEKRRRVEFLMTEWKKLVITDDPENPIKYVSIEGSEEEISSPASKTPSVLKP